MRRHLTILSALALISLLAVVYFSQGKLAEPLKLQPKNPNVVTMGKDIYDQQCAVCHGAKLEGQPNWRQRLPSGRLPAPPHDATGHTWHHPDNLLLQITKFGPGYAAGPDYESDMPGYEDILSDAEIIAALSYIKSTWPSQIQAKHDVINKRFEASQNK